ncbi:major facilitator superfamily MFS_1 [Sulfobacillus acidophilus TPY]|uniref:Major facilitator superfamily MFS_1 n=1 Tax=Sulfobacillus acidophilus (strain ATCC 700253 / DSM 10332 / NAL) TaxID=679936 RepID=G8TTS7_SULAD|nr:major facilitator superfamily MFS_1 [Sulfobacillus acidophilus TPY]AEW06836.1 major facilitator superfamily MFS_1 [Sulfobacillus acidophilus DSM 10332]
MNKSSGSIRDQVLKPLEEAGLQSFHFRTWLTAGMGFFTDAYDLFIIGVVTTLLKPLWHLTTLDLMILNSTALFSAVLGALIFGRLMDRVGRKAVYGIEAILLTAGALLSAFSSNFLMLVVFRFIVGLGVGGDYPMSGVIMSEYSNRKRRGFLVNAVFAMQGFGLLVGPAVAALLLSSGMATDVVWRVMLGLGAIPAAAVILLRRRIAETPHYALGVKGDVKESAEIVQQLTHQTVDVQGTVNELPKSWTVLFTNRRFLLTLFGTAFSWMFLDMAFYGNSVSSSLVMKALQPHGTLIGDTLTSALIFLVAAVPGYWVSAFTVDRIGRKFIQGMGFLVMALAYATLWLAPGISSHVAEFLIIYAISYFFIEFGPNSTTFVFPSEVFPVTVRGWGFGISASAGKFGAAIATFLFPLLLKDLKLSGTMGILAGISLLGFILTTLVLPEPKGKTLREASGEHLLENAQTDAVDGMSFSHV